MVRLVFRPYTQVRRAICTSAPLRASTRISPGFTLLKHSSPSFGSYHTCSGSDLQSTIVCRLKLQRFKIAFTAPTGFYTLWLACTLDFLVRVSRRVESQHYPDSSSTRKGEPSTSSDYGSATESSRLADNVPSTPTQAQAEQNAPFTLLQYALNITVSGSFHPLFRVLCNFPSRYLFAIGLLPVFSLRWDLSPILVQHSQATRLFWNVPVREHPVGDGRGFNPPRQAFSCSLSPTDVSRTTTTSPTSWICILGFSLFARRY